MENGLLRKCVDCRCVVLSTENQMLFRGKVMHYDAVNHVIRVEAGRDCAVRGFIDSQDAIKLQVKCAEDEERFVIIEGDVEQAMQNFFFMTPGKIEEKSEDRAYFRQNVMLDAAVSASEREQRSPCVIMDISATGISLQSNEEYQIGDRLYMHGQQFRQKGPVHDLDFIVVRKSTQDLGKYRFFYGCRFEDMSTDAQDRLVRDIFALQAEELRSARNR